MAYNLWDSIFAGNTTRITKALYGSFLIRDYNGQASSLQTYSPFDPVTGNLSSTLLTTDGWYDPGLISENGVQFNPKYTTNETMAWQSRTAQRTDVTVDEEECVVSFLQSGPRIDELNYGLPLNSLAGTGAIGYSVTKPTVPQMQYRQVLILGVDGSKGSNEYFAILYPRALVTKVDKFEYAAKNAVEATLTFSSYPDPFSGFAVKRFREGPAWRASGGTTTAPGTPVATPVVAAPVITLGTTSSSGGTLAAGAYYWKVTATTTLGESTGSNEVTATTTGSTSSQPLNWTAVSGATGYKVYRGTAAGAENVLVATITSGATATYTDTGAAGSAGSVPTSNTTLGAAVPAHSANLVFTPPASLNSPFTYTAIQRTPGGTGTASAVPGGNLTVVSSSSSSVTVNVAGLTPASTYDFTVTATGSNGSVSVPSSYSNVITAT